MAIVVLTSAGHSPGVTSTALGLALTWPRPVLLVDADRNPTQSILAGYLRGEQSGQHGLAGLLQAVRERRALEDVLEAQTIELPALAPTTERAARLLPGFPHPGVVGLFNAAWADLMAALSTHGSDVLIDAGRIGPEGLPLPLAQAADLVLMVTRTSLVSLAGVRLYLPGLVEAAGSDRTAMALVGAAMPYGRSEIQDQFGTTIAAEIEYAPTAAAVLSDGAPQPRRFATSGYFRSLSTAATSISGRLQAVRELIGVRR